MTRAMNVRCVLTVALVGALAGWSLPARAQDLEAALELESRGQLAGALRAFETVLSTPGNSQEDLATIFQHLGLLRFADGDAQGAREAMMWLLAVEPDASLPDSAPPEVQEILEASRERWAGRRLHGEVEAVALAGRRGVRIRLRAVDDLARMVEAVEVAEGDAVLADAVGRGPWELVVPESVVEAGQARLQVRLVDGHGGLLWEDAVDIDIPSSSGDRDARRLAPRTQRILAWCLVGAGGVLVIAGGVAAGVDGTATGNYRVVDGILEQEVRATATGGWILISAGLAAAVAGVVLLLLTPREAPVAGVWRLAVSDPSPPFSLAAP